MTPRQREARMILRDGVWRKHAAEPDDPRWSRACEVCRAPAGFPCTAVLTGQPDLVLYAFHAGR